MTSQETTEEGPANVVFEEGEMEDGDEEAMDQALSKESGESTCLISSYHVGTNFV